MPSISCLLLQAENHLINITEVAKLEAELLLSHALGKPRSFLYGWPEYSLSDIELQTFSSLLKQRAEGCPVAYLLGSQEFWSLPFRVTSDTLIPRPETELLVEQALLKLPSEQECHLLDLGTGSGAIAIALAHERPQWKILAIDSSLGALEVAQQNAALNHVENIQFMRSDWFSEIKNKKFDAIISNPPYLANQDPHLPNLTYEPLCALVSGQDGLEAFREIICHAHDYLKSEGWLMLEHGAQQQKAVYELLLNNFGVIEQKKDLAGHWRISIGGLSLRNST